MSKKTTDNFLFCHYFLKLKIIYTFVALSNKD